MFSFLQILNPSALFFLPVIVIPILLTVFLFQNRKKAIFPSLEILESILKPQARSAKTRFRLRQILRVLAVLFIISAFSGIHPGSSKNEPFTAVMDPTESMSRFDYQWIHSLLPVFGRQEGIIYGIHENSGLPVYQLEPESISSLQGTLSELDAENSLKGKRIVYVTDGQKSGFTEILTNKWGIKSLEILRLTGSADVSNCAVEEISAMPNPAVTGEKVDFSIRLSGQIMNGIQIKVLLNTKEIYSGTAKTDIRFSHFADAPLIHKGVNLVTTEITGDVFTNDNAAYLAFVSTGKPSVYYSNGIPLIKDYIEAVFPHYSEVSVSKTPEILITTGKDKWETNQLVLIFADERDSFETALRMNMELNPIEEVNSNSGRIQLNFNNELLPQKMDLKTAYRLSNLPDNLVFAKINNQPICYRVKNVYVFPFSITDNIKALSENPSLLFVIQKAVSDFYNREYISETLQKNLIYINAAGSMANPDEKTGFYLERETGKIFVMNNGKEADWNFISGNTLGRHFFGFPELKTTDVPLQSKNNPAQTSLISTILISIAWLIVLLEFLMGN